MRSQPTLFPHVLVLLLSTFLVGVAQAQINFDGAPRIAYGEAYGDLYTVGDFNRDGRDDIFMGDGQVLHGRPSGRLKPVQGSSGALPGIQNLATVDFDRDGNLDVVAWTQVDGLYVYTNSGTGTFAAPEVAVPEFDANSVSLGVADFSGDGIPDLFNMTDRYWAIWPGLLSGGFSTSAIEVDTVPFDSVDLNRVGKIFDVTGDGRLDLVIATRFGLRYFAADPAGGLVRPAIEIDLPSINDFSGGDIDGDGDFDFVSYNSQRVVVSETTPTGWDHLEFDQNPEGIACLDLDQDGTCEIIVSDDELKVYQYLPGPFPNVLPIQTAILDRVPRRCSTGDFNGDDVLDLIGGFGSSEAGIIVALAPTDGTLGFPRFIRPPGQYGRAIPVDLDLDGVLDVFFIESKTSGDPRIQFRSGPGGPTQVVPIGLPVPGTVHDLNNDGLLDLASPSTVWWNRGNRQFDTEPLPAANGIMAVADADADGDQDLWLRNGNNGVQILFNNDDETFTAGPIVQFSMSVRYLVPPTDIDDDGDLDLIVISASTAQLAINEGGVLSPQPAATSPFGAFQSTGLYDMDADGTLELVTALDEDLLRFAELSTDGVLGPWGTYPLRDEPSSLAVADLDLDGRSELLVDMPGGVVAILNQQPSGLETIAQLSLGGVALKDLDSDGKLDLYSWNDVTYVLNLSTVIQFIRADSNLDGTINLGDPIRSLDYLFNSGMVDCEAALDANGDATINLGDVIFTLDFLFQAGSNPPAPWPDCAPQRDFDLTCERSCP